MGKLWAGAGKVNPDSLGKEGDANSPWKSWIVSQDWCSCSVQRLLEALSIWEYPWNIPEFLWEGAVWLGNCWLLCTWLSVTWDLLCSWNFPTIQERVPLPLLGFCIVSGSFPNKNSMWEKLSLVLQRSGKRSSGIESMEAAGGAVGLNP
ncbi:hypothetical protein Nmel_000048, partial [Mimus melanotis]